MVTPRIALSTRSDPLMSIGGWQSACASAGIDNLDLDVSNRLRHRLIARNLGLTLSHPDSVRSIWLGMDVNPKIVPGDAKLVILPEQLLLDSQGGDESLFKQLERYKRELDDSVDLAVALTPRNREGSRAHLGRISSVRHIAEEWDLGIALDLTKDVDSNWEAEAAVMRLGDRLRIVRFTAPNGDGMFPFYGRPTDLMTSRVLSWLAETGFAGTLSMKLALHWWNWSDPAAAAVEAVRVGTALLAKFATQRTEVPHPRRRVI